MELTNTVTAILALVSFGFVAAIILGMIYRFPLQAIIQLRRRSALDHN